jgi:orotate phosphoribosyltransferase
MKIKFEKKFTQKDLDVFVEEYFADSLENNSIVEFDLEQLEWITSEEITFLFAWLRKLHLLNKRLTVQLPSSLVKEGDEFQLTSIGQTVNKSLQRRKFIKYYIWSVWRMFTIDDSDILKANNIKLENIDDINKLIDEQEGRDYGKKILPFQIINTELNSDDAVDVKFYTNTKRRFSIDKDIIQLLNENNCYSPFENRVISDIITKELFMNSAEHAQTDECYFTTALRNKWKYIDNQYFLDQFINEKDESTLDFFKNKEYLLKIVKTNALQTKDAILKNIKKEGKGGKIIVNLSRKKENGDFYKPEYNNKESLKNQSFLEFTFIDFGIGIHETLKAAYNNNKEQSLSLLSDNIENKHIHSQILEYAFLLSSSKDPFDNRIERSDLIPRGLYFLIDMVRRYKGLLVARSGYGKVVYDFSDRIIIENKYDDELSICKKRCTLVKDAVVSIKNKTAFFPGTMISIVLPEREAGKFRKAGVRIDDYRLNEVIYNRDHSNDYYPKEVFAPHYYEYLPLAFLYQVSDMKTSSGSLPNEKNVIINSAFISISNKLQAMNVKDNSGVVFIDFDGLPKRNYVYKILLYLSNSPLVNEKVKVIAVNIEDEELNALKEYERKSELIKETSFLFKTIPCIKLAKSLNQEITINDINWIGVPDKDNEFILTELLTGKRKAIHISKIDDEYKYLYEGNVITKSNDGWITSIFASIDDLITNANSEKLLSNNLEINLGKFKTDVINNILEWIQKEVVEDGEKDKKLFLATNGAYQTKYLSFYNRLVDDSVAMFFAKFLLDKYIETQIADYENREHKSFDALSNEEQMNVKKTFRFNKILAVTVSSQFLAVQFRNLIWKNEAYSFLLNENENEDLKQRKTNLEDCPDLIKVSSYFSFEKEKPFGNIKENQNILIINDVISSGSLINRLVKGIESRKSSIKSILSIVDTRRAEKDIDKNEEYPSITFDAELENKIISIISSKQNPDFIVKKLRNKPKETENYKIKRINPILNAVVTLNSRHSEKDKILVEDLKEFKLIKEDIFQIGHFKHNSFSCSGFYFDLNTLFRDERGKELLKELKRIMDERLIKIGQEKCEPHFIFQPVYSALEEVSKTTYYSVFNSKDESGKDRLSKNNIISLQRYETPYGWRFVFPAKRYNHELVGKNILILDSGTLLGQSLIQLIDAVSIYEVNRIDVLTVVGKLDDFQREFHSRLERLKVKPLNNKDRQVSADVNVFFGMNIHIMPFHTEDKCPFCKETKILEKYLSNYSGKMPQATEEYITNRLKNEIKKQESGNSRETVSYIPKDKDGKYDFKNIFLMRDLLGKIDGYRFYEDYFDEIDTLCGRYPDRGQERYENKDLFDKKNSNDLRQFEQILICILHESDLLSCIKNLIKNLFDILEYIIKEIVCNDTIIEKLNYEWSKYALLRVYYFFCDKTDFYTINNFELIFQFCMSDDNALNYFSFIIWESYHFKDNLKEYTRNILIQMNDKFDNPPTNDTIYSDDKIRSIIKSIVHRFELNQPQNVNDAFYNLKKFFIKESSADSHSDFKRQVFQLISGVEDRDITADNINNLIELCMNISKKLNYLGTNLETIKDCVSKGNRSKYDNLYTNESSVYKKLYEICSDCTMIQNSKEQIFETKNIAKIQAFANKIDAFQTEFLLEGKPFVKYCKKYMTDLKLSISEAKKVAESRYKREKKQAVFLKIENIHSDDVLVNIHRGLLEDALEEIFYNALKYQNDKNTVISCKVNQCDDNIVELTISQNKGFRHSGRENGHGIETTIKPIFEAFCGEKGINFDSGNKDRYDIKIIFNSYKLKDN